MTWSLTPQYFITEDLTVYATAAHGFKSGGFNIGWGTTPMDQRQFQDEDIMHYETGLKSTLLDGRMQLAVSRFYTSTMTTRTRPSSVSNSRWAAPES